MGEVAKLHHTVPQFYIRGCASEPRGSPPCGCQEIGVTPRSSRRLRRLKHFFDTVYYPILDYMAGRPYGLWVHGNNDTVGAAKAVEKVATGLSLAKAADVLEITGAIDAKVRERAYELGGTLAAMLME